MRRSYIRVAGLLQGAGFGKEKFFTSLWSKPETKDERVKEYVPEVLEESLEEQRAVLQESTSRDVIVELGHKILREIENKSPTPSIAPQLNKLLIEYGTKDIIAQRPLSYLLYPSSNALSGGEQPHELVAGFPDNFRALIEEVERSGCSIKCSVKGTDSTVAKGKEGEASSPQDSAEAAQDQNLEGSHEDAEHASSVGRPESEHEPMDVTMFIKVASGMALANMHCNDMRNAVRCVDAGIAHAIDQQRLGGLLGLKAGLLVHQKKFDEAAETAKLAIEASGNIQGYQHGAYALRMLRKSDELVALLEDAVEQHPMNRQLSDQLETARQNIKLALPKSSSSTEKKVSTEKALPSH